MNQEDAFLQAVREDPDDDAVRLIFADWLEERGDPRGEFIRIQCALAGMPEQDERRAAWQDLAERLLRQHEPRWVGPLPSRVKSYTFRRGFVAEVTVAAATFLRHAPFLFAHHPIRKVSILSLDALPAPPSYGGRYDLAEFFGSVYLERLAALEVSDQDLSVAQVRALAESPRLAGLRHLDLSGTNLTIAHAQTVAASPHLHRLNTLLLNRNPLDSLGVGALVASPVTACLTWLELEQTRLANSGARALLEAPHLAGLKRLSLRGNDISPPLQEALLARFGREVCLL